jgi:hypothetical protein
MYGTRDFAATEIDDMRRGLDYWTAVLKPAGAPFTPVIVRAGVKRTGITTRLRFFSSEHNSYGRVYEALQGGTDLSPEPSDVSGDLLAGAHTLTFFHNYTWDTQPNSQLPETAATLAPTVIHEIGHALGIFVGNYRFSKWLEGTPYDPTSPDTLSTFVFQGPLQTQNRNLTCFLL